MSNFIKYLIQKSPISLKQTQQIKNYLDFLKQKSKALQLYFIYFDPCFRLINFVFSLDQEKLQKQSTLMRLRKKFGTTYVFGAQEALNKTQTFGFSVKNKVTQNTNFDKLQKRFQQRKQSTQNQNLMSKEDLISNSASQRQIFVNNRDGERVTQQKRLLNQRPSTTYQNIQEKEVENLQQKYQKILMPSSLRMLSRQSTNINRSQNRNSVRSLSSVDSNLVDKIIRIEDGNRLKRHSINPYQQQNREDMNRTQELSSQNQKRLDHFFQRRKQSADATSTFRPRTTNNQSFGRQKNSRYELEQFQANENSSQKLENKSSQNKLQLSTSYIQFNNNRIVPQIYIKQREERLNKTMENVQKELFGMKKSIPSLNYLNSKNIKDQVPSQQEKTSSHKISQSFNGSKIQRRTRNTTTYQNKTQIFNKDPKHQIKYEQSPIMNRHMRIKDTFLSLFPVYGVSPDRQVSEVQHQMTYSDFNFIEQKQTAKVDRSNFAKRDDFKRYTEELLKTQNMRGRK
eukprot:403376594